MKSGSALKAVVVIFALALLFGCRRQESASEKLLALAPHSARPIEARLSGFEWPEARVQRGTPNNLLDPSRLELAGAASAVIQSFANNPSAHARHEAGAAFLLIDRDRDAIDALESAVRQSPKEATYWSDLSAARYTLAVREKRPHELPQALADADHALRIKPTLHNALFNRALIIEALGITEAARRAWQRYVAADPSSHWAAEAMHHLGNLRVVTTRDEFQNRLALASRASDDAPLVALARNFPQEARTWSEGPLLAKWADAFRKGDAKSAAETLSVVRKLGAALAEFNHVYSVVDVVAAIDRADAEHVRILADAHAEYRDARVLYRDRHVVAAQEGFRRAGSLFVRGSSPMAIITEYYLANCLYDTNRPAEALHALDDVLTRFDPKRYPALAAEIGWEQTLCHAALGSWDAAIRTASASRKIFSGLGETQNRAEMDVLLGSHLNHADQPAAAWKARISALPILSDAGSSDRVRNSLISGMSAEAAHGRFEVALSLAGVALDDLTHNRQPMGISIAEAARAEASAKLGDSNEARRAIARARRSAVSVPDPSLQRRAVTAIDIAEGVVVRDGDPVFSLKLLDKAVAFYTSGRSNAWLPKAYLERGRTNVRAKNDAAAFADFEAGLREVDLERSSISDKERRGTFYDTEPELFAELIALLLRRDDKDGAFEFSDSARARSVYEQVNGGNKTEVSTRLAEQLRASLPSGTALVEYALLRDTVVIFYFSSSRSGVVRVPASLTDLSTIVERYADLLQRRGELASVQREAAALHRLLLAPVAGDLAGTKRLIIVPDRVLHSVPFAALYDAPRERYVIDDFAVSVALSAASVLQHRDALQLEPVLVVGDPHDEGAPALPEAAHEAEAIAAMYNSATLLTGDRATRSRFLAAVQQSRMIHYAGHADSDSADPFGSLHLAADNAHETGDLDADAIATLHLRNAPMVILAACGTMRGDSAHIEGMPSIARAFLAAGAGYVVGTLWEVDDASVSPLFRRMHEGLRGGASPSAALRGAQIALAHGPDPYLRHPATWAPVELLGYASEQPSSVRKRSE